jgi:hypothetical protein
MLVVYAGMGVPVKRCAVKERMGKKEEGQEQEQEEKGE